MSLTLLSLATANVTALLAASFDYPVRSTKVLVVYDTDYGLTRILTTAYRQATPGAEFLDFAAYSRDELIARFDALASGDLVVLIQSGSFRLNKFRIRLQLFNRGLRVIEHMHLHRNPESTWASHLRALNPDTRWYQEQATRITGALQTAKQTTIVTCRGGDELRLVVDGPVEEPKLNIGDYRGFKNIGGTFPIGEVFTEAQDLASLSGSAYVYAFAGADFNLHFPEPFRVDIEAGLIVGWSKTAPAGFGKVVRMVKAQERPLIREIGFGLNRGIDPQSPLLDVTAFERVRGVHLSLGEKHSTYKKPGIRAHKARYHIDLFLATERVEAGQVNIFRNGRYLSADSAERFVA